MNIKEILAWGYLQLNNSKLTSANPMDADVLLSFITNISREDLRAHSENKLKRFEIKKFEKLIARRLQGQPLAYLIGHRHFYGHRFEVNNDVLIPQPDTETLIDEAVKYKKNDPVYLDIGTGSGAIAISVALETGRPVIASDVSTRALTKAKRNARKLKALDKVTFLKGSLLEPFIKQAWSPNEFIVLLANLPYLSNKQWIDASDEVKNEPTKALVSGPDGLNHYRKLFDQLKLDRKIFPDEMIVIIEIDPSQSEKILKEIQSRFPKAQPVITKDLAGHDRIVTSKL